MLFISSLVHLQECIQRYRTRKALENLPPELMKDLGISECERYEELSHKTLSGFLKEVFRFKTKQSQL